MNRKILYIEDEPDLIELATSFFEDEKLPIDHCSSVKDAINLIKQNQYDVIISDVQLPDGNGHELFDIIKRDSLFSGKFILVTGNLHSGREANHRYDQVIYKPIDFFGLIDIVRRSLI